RALGERRTPVLDEEPLEIRVERSLAFAYPADDLVREADVGDIADRPLEPSRHRSRRELVVEHRRDLFQPAPAPTRPLELARRRGRIRGEAESLALRPRRTHRRALRRREWDAYLVGDGRRERQPNERLEDRDASFARRPAQRREERRHL